MLLYKRIFIPFKITDAKIRYPAAVHAYALHMLLVIDKYPYIIRCKNIVIIMRFQYIKDLFSYFVIFVAEEKGFGIFARFQNTYNRHSVAKILRRQMIKECFYFLYKSIRLFSAQIIFSAAFKCIMWSAYTASDNFVLLDSKMLCYLFLYVRGVMLIFIVTIADHRDLFVLGTQIYREQMSVSPPRLICYRHNIHTICISYPLTDAIEPLKLHRLKLRFIVCIQRLLIKAI